MKKAAFMLNKSMHEQLHLVEMIYLIGRIRITQHIFMRKICSLINLDPRRGSHTRNKKT